VRARTLRATGTDAERLLWRHLRDRRLGGFKFRRQHPVGVYFADFACLEAGLIVEVDGGQHYEPTVERDDARRTQFLSSQGFDVLRFSNREVLAEIDGVLASVLERLKTGRRADPHPSPLPQAGEGVTLTPAPLPQTGDGVKGTAR
jgi:adenine-specific DNA-methyltransferase